MRKNEFHRPTKAYVSRKSRRYRAQRTKITKKRKSRRFNDRGNEHYLSHRVLTVLWSSLQSMVVQQRWRKRCHPSIAMRQPWEHWSDRSWPESSVRQRRYSVIDRRSTGKPSWKGLYAVHDRFWRLKERRRAKTTIVDKHDEKIEAIYYRNSPRNSRVNDVIDPRTYRRGWDNSMFSLSISTESSTARFLLERDLHGLRTSVLRRPSSNGSDREFRATVVCCSIRLSVCFCEKKKYSSFGLERIRRRRDSHRWWKWILAVLLPSTISPVVQCQQRWWQMFGLFPRNSSFLSLSSVIGWRQWNELLGSFDRSYRDSSDAQWLHGASEWMVKCTWLLTRIDHRSNSFLLL